MHPRFVEAVQKLYPKADFRVDLRIEDDGTGPKLVEWNLPGTPPTDAQIEEVLARPPTLSVPELLALLIDALEAEGVLTAARAARIRDRVMR